VEILVLKERCTNFLALKDKFVGPVGKGIEVILEFE